MTDSTCTRDEWDRADHELDVRKDDAMDRAYMAREIQRLRLELDEANAIAAAEVESNVGIRELLHAARSEVEQLKEWQRRAIVEVLKARIPYYLHPVAADLIREAGVKP